MEHAIFIREATAVALADRLSLKSPKATVRPAMSRGELLGYHIVWGSVVVTENMNASHG